MMTPDKMIVGGRYNWIGQEERLHYLGVELYPGNGLWHQFAKVGEELVWCEVRASDLEHFEETIEGDRRLVLTDLPVRMADFDGIEARIIGVDEGYSIWPAREPHKMKKGKPSKAEKKASKKARTRAWIEQQGEQHVG